MQAPTACLMGRDGRWISAGVDQAIFRNASSLAVSADEPS